jgi:hypothetical protein
VLESIRYEWRARGLLKKIARQRVAMIMQPGNVWVIELAAPINDETMPMVQTLLLRGWVEVLQSGVHHGQLGEDGSLPQGPLFTRQQDIWRVTDSGWSTIHRAHQLSVLAIVIAILGVIVAI